MFLAEGHGVQDEGKERKWGNICGTQFYTSSHHSVTLSLGADIETWGFILIRGPQSVLVGAVIFGLNVYLKLQYAKITTVINRMGGHNSFDACCVAEISAELARGSGSTETENLRPKAPVQEV